MEDIKLSRESFHHRLVQYNFPGYYTDSLCNYFWKFLLALVLTPFSILAREIIFRFIPPLSWSDFSPPFMGFISTCCLAIAYVVLSNIYASTQSVLATIVIFFLPALIPIVTLGCMLLFYTDTARLLRLRLEAKKNKVCPIIKWQNNEET